MSKIDSLNEGAQDVNDLLVSLTGLIPVLGGLISGAIVVAQKFKSKEALVFLEEASKLQTQISAIRANDAQWRGEHPEAPAAGEAQPTKHEPFGEAEQG